MNNDGESVTMVDETAEVEVPVKDETVEAEVPSTESVEVDPLDAKLVAQTDDSLFELYVENNLPPHLRGAAAEGSVEIEEDLAAHRSECRRTWNEKLKRGYTARQLARLDRQPEVRALTDTPVPPPAPTVSAEQEAEASRLYKWLDHRHLLGRVPPTLGMDLEYAYQRRFSGTPERLAAAIDAGAAVANASQREQERRVTAEAGKVLVRVHAECGPARKYKPGEYRLTSEELEELRSWWAGWQQTNLHRAAKAYSTCPFEVVEAA